MPTTTSKTLTLAVAAFLGLYAQHARATEIIDQEQTAAQVEFVNFTSSIAQSFTPTDTNSAGAAFEAQLGSAPHVTLTIELATALTGGTILASGSTYFNSGIGLIDVSWAPVAVTPGQTYYLLVSSSDPTWGIVGSYPQNDYANGATYVNGSAITYAGAAFEEFAAVVPEPGTLALLGSGIAGLGWLRRRSGQATQS